MKNRINLLYVLLLLQFHQGWASMKNDSIEALMDKYHQPYLLAFSPKGNWAVAERRYGRSSDTVMVYSTSGKGKIMGAVINMKVSRTFLKEEVLLSSGVGTAEYWNLSTQQKIEFQGLKKTIGLAETGTFCLLEKGDTAAVYDISGTLLYKVPHVIGYPLSNGLNRTFVRIMNGHLSEIYDISGTKPIKIYSTMYVLDQVQMSDQNRFLTAKEYNPVTYISSAVMINTERGTVKTISIPDLRKDDFISFAEMNNGLSLMINVNRPQQKSKMVEIWYGNDGNLLNTEKGFSDVQLTWFFDLYEEKVERITTLPQEKLLSSGNGRHFFSFIEGAVQDYRTLNEHVDMSVYDRLTKKYTRLDTIRNADLYLSAHGNVVAYRTMNKKWNYYNLLTNEKMVIGGVMLRNPTFSDNDQSIYFESDHGLYLFSCNNYLLKQIPETKDNQVEIFNKIKTGSNVGNVHFYKIIMEKRSPLLVKMWNENLNITSYYKYQDGHVKGIIPSNTNNISSVLFARDGQKVVFVEENYNVSPKIIFKDNMGLSKKTVTLDVTHDFQAAQYQQEMIRYNNSEGKPLKGILYFPAQFDPRKKYPMVVKIYQVQSSSSNHYYTIGYSNYVGFDLRLLVEKGYFVFLPDIVYGDQGTGVSALDCVNKALDAVLSRTFIDSSKIGLIGHSHGAYETNFIATHSNRFAAYHSGAGNSDIVRSYFSYNYNFHSPFYWQYEDGQYEMPVPFMENKALYFKNNPIHNVNQVNAPILLWAGKKDKNIAWDQVMEFYIGLKRHRKEVIALFYPNQGHALGALSPERKDLYYRSLQWWDYFLKDHHHIPWIDEQMKKRLSQKDSLFYGRIFL